MIAILFDIDGTLLHTNGAGSRALARVFAERYGWPEATAKIDFAGRTDPLIVADTLAAHGAPCDESACRSILARYTELLGEELARGPRGVVFPGVTDMLARLRELEHACVGLLTGNVADGARQKLSHYELWGHFGFGAYGDDAADRPALLPIALERAERHHGHRFGPRDAVIVGDTPRDVEVGHAHGVRTIGVATGTYDADALRAAGADRVFDDFSDVAVALEAILDGGAP